MDRSAPSPPLHTDDDPGALAHLRAMYKRYMLNPAVAAWLLARDAPTDFHNVRRENSVLVSTTCDSPPKVVPHHAPNTPFPASTDLMFLDHVHDAFALGHVWGSVQTDAHPYAPLAARAFKTGWDRVRTRKFASDLTADRVLESVEYAWFTDNRAIVILSRVPFAPGERTVRVSEVLFFGPTHRPDIPPQRPELVLLVHDRAMCTTCRKELCACPNTLGINRGTTVTCLVSRPETPEQRSHPPTERVLQSWQDRARTVFHGSKRGLLSVVYTGSFAGNVSQITVRQPYLSVCENQDAIGLRIQQHLTKLLSRMPPVPNAPPPHRQPTTITVLPEFPSNDDGGVTLMQDMSANSPLSFTPKDAAWLESPRQRVLPAQTDMTPSTTCGPGKQACCSSKAITPKTATPCTPKSGTSCARNNWSGEPQCRSSRGPSQKQEEQTKPDQTNTSTGTVRSAGSTAGAHKRKNGSAGSLCGPEKAGKECDCSAEKMQDPSLALILNSRCDRGVPNALDEITSFIEPIFANASVGNGSLLQPVPSVARASVITERPGHERGRIDSMAGTVPFETQSPDSTRCGASTTLPSPLPPPPVQMEPALKRPRTDQLLKSDSFAFGLESGWPTALDDREKGLSLPPWNVTGGIERPLSALSRALGGARSPSPLALMSTLQKTPSPPAPPVGMSGVPFGRSGNQEFDFHNAFDSLSASAHGDSAKKQDEPVGLGIRLSLGAPSSKKESSPVSGSKNTSDLTTTPSPDAAGGNGVCCEICGISFAKRSNKLRHIQTVHNRLKQFKCDLCGTKFGLKADLGRHRYRIHESRAFRCDTCGKSFAEQGQLEHHVRVTHEEDSRPWECKTCRIRFGRKSSLTRHEQTVHQQTRFVCRVCKKSYSQKFDAVRHERRVHGIHDKAGSAGIKQVMG